MNPTKSGPLTSEGEKAYRAEVAGFTLMTVGMIAFVISSMLCAGLVSAASVGLAAVGAYLVAHTTAAYTQSRAAVKSAALAPPPAPTQITQHHHSARPPRGV